MMVETMGGGPGAGAVGVLAQLEVALARTESVLRNWSLDWRWFNHRSLCLWRSRCAHGRRSSRFEFNKSLLRVRFWWRFEPGERVRPCLTDFSKPSARTISVYVPAGTDLNLYLPCELATVLRSALDFSSCKVTCAKGTTTFVVSKTVPARSTEGVACGAEALPH